MEFGDPGAAMRAKTELARRNAGKVRARAREQRADALAQREAETRAVREAQGLVPLDGPLLRCGRCGGIWRSEEIAAATRRRPGCLLCGGKLVSVAAD